MSSYWLSSAASSCQTQARACVRIKAAPVGRCTPSRRTPQCSAENRRGDWRSTPRKLSRSRCPFAFGECRPSYTGHLIEQRNRCATATVEQEEQHKGGRCTTWHLADILYEKGIAYYDSIKKRAAERQWQRRKQNPLTFVSDGLANVGVRLWRFHDQKWVFWLLIIIFTVNFWIVMSHI